MGASALWSIHFLIGFAAISCTFLFLQYRGVLDHLVAAARTAPVSGWMVGAHFCSVAFLFAISFQLSAETGGTLVIPWVVGCGSVLTSAALAMLPWRLWKFAARKTGLLAIYSATGAAAAASAVLASGRLWVPMSGVTFQLVRLILSPVLSGMVVQPENFRVGSRRFTAVISPECSGLEGISLFLIFLAIWLILFRKEIRFPQVLVLIPAGVAILFVLNAARIATLILIGHLGARDVAAQGFHSQAGWILFNVVALGISIGARRIPWIARQARPDGERLPKKRDDSVSIFLIPFLAILTAGMVSRAVSGKFEWFYGLRLVAAVGAFWLFRREYWAITRQWRWDWVATAVGVAVCAIWIGMDWGGVPAPRTSGANLVWIVLRAATAITVVPLAEELAFRGYLMRRLAGSDFETVRPDQAPWWAVALSSLLFGLLHGSRWLAGTVAGVAYALVYRRRRNLGDAVTAHAVTNALLAVYVLSSGDWRFW